MKFFNLIDVGERSGRGIYEIYRIWENMNWDSPIIDEMLDFDRTKLTLPLKKVTTKSDGKKVTAKSDGKKVTTKSEKQKEFILNYIYEYGQITTADAAELLDVGTSRAKTLLYQLVDSEKIIAQGEDKNRSYVLAKNI